MSDITEEQITCSLSGTHFAYHVEVRSGVKHPICLHNKWYGSEWIWFHPERSCLPPSELHREDWAHDLLTYETAMAIAWAVQAYAKSFVEKNSFGVQVRVVQSKVEHSYKAIRIKEFPNIPWRGDGNEEP